MRVIPTHVPYDDADDIRMTARESHDGLPQANLIKFPKICASKVVRLHCIDVREARRNQYGEILYPMIRKRTRSRV